MTEPTEGVAGIGLWVAIFPNLSNKTGNLTIEQEKIRGIRLPVRQKATKKRETATRYRLSVLGATTWDRRAPNALRSAFLSPLVRWPRTALPLGISRGSLANAATRSVA